MIDDVDIARGDFSRLDTSPGSPSRTYPAASATLFPFGGPAQVPAADFSHSVRLASRPRP